MPFPINASNELQLYNALTKIFPGECIRQNVKREMNIKYPATGKLMEFDIWIPDLHLCFEFQDAYHYVDAWYSQNNQDHIRERDGMKEVLAMKQGSSLVIVPCWWGQSQESLTTSICFHRPDLREFVRLSEANAISLNPPVNYFVEHTIPDVEGLMLASFPFFNFLESFAEFQWWLGEKYDGIRCCWVPRIKQAYTRQGKAIPFAPGFVARFPSTLLDGEVWFGRGLFAYASAVQAGLANPHSPLLRVVAFDIPSLALHTFSYEHRYRDLLAYLDTENPFLVVAVRSLCQNDTLMEVVQSILDSEGEGVILQKCGTRYDFGRSESLVKLKTTHADQEGVVVRIGEANAVLLKLSTGTIITVPPENVLIQTPAVGEVVTFSFDAYSRRDIPANPTIFRVRTDLGWDDMAHTHSKEKQTLGDSSYLKGITKPRGYWTAQNMREYMESFAKHKNLDPLKPDTWYSSFKAFLRSPSGRTILSKFKYGYYHALNKLFPELKLDRTMLQFYKIENRRKFFENYAKTMGFDHLNPNNWYSQPLDKILATKGSRGVLHYHKFSVSRALRDLFPNIGLEKSKFGLSRSYWENPQNRRNFLENYAVKHRFDPLNPENWYIQPKARLLAFAGMPMAILHHGRSISQAIVDLFPDIGLDSSRFGLQNYWTQESNRRRFFETYAKNNGFDPQVAKNWYSQTREIICSVKGANSIASFHNNSVAQALIDLFPEVHFDKSKLFKKDWSDIKTRRNFFIKYAAKHGFDPLKPDNWKNQIENLRTIQGIVKVVSHHGGSVKKALADLFPNVMVAHSLSIEPPQKHWESATNRRIFFETYATANNFDALVPENWYTQAISKIVSVKGAYALLAFHSGSVSKALRELFPEVTFDAAKFGSSNFWKQAKNQRFFFESFAKTKGFDPLDADAWYEQSIMEIMEQKGARSILRYHPNGVPAALIAVFPDIGLSLDGFASLKKRLENSENRRVFFEDYAVKHGFNPYNPNSWYLQQKPKLLREKGTTILLTHHGDSIAQALSDLFPNIGLEMPKLQSLR